MKLLIRNDLDSRDLSVVRPGPTLPEANLQRARRGAVARSTSADQALDATWGGGGGRCVLRVGHNLAAGRHGAGALIHQRQLDRLASL